MDTLIPDPSRAHRSVSDRLANRVTSLTGDEVEDMETEMEKLPTKILYYDDEYSVVRNLLHTKDGRTIQSIVCLPSKRRDCVLDRFSLWPGQVNLIDKESKLKTIGHNLTNAAVDKYVTHSTVSEVDMSAPDLTLSQPCDEVMESTDEQTVGFRTTLFLCDGVTLHHILLVNQQDLPNDMEPIAVLQV